MSRKPHTSGDSESGVRPLLGLVLLAAIIYAMARIVIGAI